MSLLDGIVAYLTLVIKKSVTSIFLLADALGVVVLVLSFKVESLPWYLSVLIFVLVVIASGYSVWSDQVKQTASVQDKLDDLTRQIPEYVIQLTSIRKFSISSKIDSVSSEIERITSKIEKSKQEIKPEARPDTNSFFPISALQTLSESMRRATDIFGSIAKTESDEERLVRLQKHLDRLMKYQNSLEYIYLIDWSIQSSRADVNIEIELRVDGENKLILEDNFAQNNVPNTREPGSGMDDWMYGGDLGMPRVSSIYSSNHVSNDKKSAFSEIKNLNAQRPMKVYDDELYLISKNEEATVNFTVHSRKKIKPQLIKIPVKLTDVNIEQIEDESIGEDSDV